MHLLKLEFVFPSLDQLIILFPEALCVLSLILSLSLSLVNAFFF